MQPFDGGEFDKRFDEVYKPAIEKAGLEPYRVDRDPSASVLIENIESGIIGSAACCADITKENANVWFELGFAICAKKPICLVCGEERERFPFDVQHRKIIKYKKSSPSDFTSLHNAIVERLKAILASNETIEEIIREQAGSNGNEIGLMEFAALCIIFENQESAIDQVSAWSIVNDMERAGYTKIATKIALRKLVQAKMIEGSLVQTTINDEPHYAYTTTVAGADCILRNESKIELKRKGESRTSRAQQLMAKISPIEDDIPF